MTVEGRRGFADWGVKAAIFAAGAVTGIAVWSQLRPQEKAAVVATGEAKAPAVAAVPARPADAARDIYMAAAPQPAPDTVAVAAEPVVPGLLPAASGTPEMAAADSLPSAPMVGEEVSPAVAPATTAPDQREGEGVFDMLDTPAPDAPGSVAMVQPPEPAPDTPPEPVAPPPLGALEEKYLAALERSVAGVTGADKAPWDVEIQRVRRGQPLPAGVDGLPEPLAKLQGIYRREKERENSPAASPDARQLEFFVYANGELKLYLNGQPQPWVSSNAGVNRASLKLKPGDVLGFELPSNREMAVIARSGVRTMFSTSDTWEAVENPGSQFWTGGKAENRARVAKEKSGFKTRMTYYEQVAKAHSSDYSLIWGQGRGTVGFRYIIRKVDLPERE